MCNYGSCRRSGRREQVVDSDMPYEEVQSKVRKGIDDYFKLQLGRPEILNRIGENIVVFDFIRPEMEEQTTFCKKQYPFSAVGRIILMNR